MKLFKFLALTFLLSTSLHVRAATVFFDAQKQIQKQGEVLTTVKIDTERININTVSGSINIPPSFDVSKIYDGESTIVVWIEQPKFDVGTHSISFSGITPGGFAGVQKLFSFVLKPTKQGTFSLNSTNLEIYKNDGKGTAVSAKAKPFVFVVSNKTSSAVVNLQDKISPEEFTPVISESSDIYNGNYFVSFASTDKGVGIDHYETAQTWFFTPKAENWTKNESPLVLDSFSNIKIIYIKAVDKLGNERVKSIWGPYRIRALSGLGILIILSYFSLASRKRKS